jgi:hypothetical protein
LAKHRHVPPGAGPPAETSLQTKPAASTSSREEPAAAATEAIKERIFINPRLLLGRLRLLWLLRLLRLLRRVRLLRPSCTARDARDTRDARIDPTATGRAINVLAAHVTLLRHASLGSGRPCTSGRHGCSSALLRRATVRAKPSIGEGGGGR